MSFLCPRGLSALLKLGYEVEKALPEIHALDVLNSHSRSRSYHNHDAFRISGVDSASTQCLSKAPLHPCHPTDFCTTVCAFGCRDGCTSLRRYVPPEESFRLLKASEYADQPDKRARRRGRRDRHDDQISRCATDRTCLSWGCLLLLTTPRPVEYNQTRR